jgi:hypothetical protein
MSMDFIDGGGCYYDDDPDRIIPRVPLRKRLTRWLGDHLRGPAGLPGPMGPAGAAGEAGRSNLGWSDLPTDSTVRVFDATGRYLYKLRVRHDDV